MTQKFYYLLLLAFTQPVLGQVNFFGKPGYMATPSAQWEKEKPLGISFAHLPPEYSLLRGNQSSLNFYNVGAKLSSFMEVNLSIAYRPSLSDRIGVGDRQFDFRFRLLSESKILPSVVVGLTPPGSRLPILAHDYLVATKNINTSIGIFRFNAGYGSPYVFTRKGNEDNTFWKSLRIQNRNEIYESNYLIGAFGGLAYMPADFGGLMLEYDSRTINAGAFVKPWDWLYLQAYTFEGKKFAFQVATQLRLDFAPRALRRYEKNLD